MALNAPDDFQILKGASPHFSLSIFPSQFDRVQHRNFFLPLTISRDKGRKHIFPTNIIVPSQYPAGFPKTRRTSPIERQTFFHAVTF
jgi:hypothetical protein